MSDSKQPEQKIRTLAEWQLALHDRPALRYLGALVLSLMALGLRLWVDQALGTRIPFGISVLAVTLTAFFFGAGPGVLTTVLTVIVAIFFRGKPSGDSSSTTFQFLLLAVFILNGLAVATAAGLLQRTLRARREAELEAANALRREKLARASAERAYEIRSRLLARVSHELRTPLAPARLIIQSALEDDMMPLSRRDLEVLQRSIAAELQLADELMDHSQLGAGKVRLRREPISPEEAIRAAIDTCIASEEWNGPVPTLVGTLATEVTVSTDPLRFQQIICNLLRNAGKFTPRDGSIQVRLESDGSTFVARICDTGRGISPEMLPRIFDEFEQGDHGAGTHGGMGLGLAIAQSLTKLHDGRLTAHSDGLGKGAQFTLELPICRDTRVPVAVA